MFLRLLMGKIYKRWFGLSLASLVLVAICLRFWNLGGIPTSFDEVFIPKLGYGYILNEQSYPFPNAHPPVGSYIFTASIWLYYQMPWTEKIVFTETAYEELDPLSYRWLNALLGSFLPLLLSGFTLLLTRNKLASVLVCLFATVEGTLLVDSRLGINNIHILLFGFFGYFALSKALDSQRHMRQWLCVTGVMFGLAIGVKWSALGFLAGIYGAMILFLLFYQLDKYRPAESSSADLFSIQLRRHPAMVKSIQWWEWCIYLIVLPALTYVLAWYPDLQVNFHMGFWGSHEQAFSYHNSVPADDHPYCSRWYSWPAMTRPVGYFFESGISSQDGVTTVFRDIHGFGNPFLHWMSSLAMVAMVVLWLKNVVAWFTSGVVSLSLYVHSVILMGYFANFVPWMLVSRCLFLYHYQPSSLFAIIALAWFLTRMIQYPNRWVQASAYTAVTIVVVSFLYWSPLYLALEISREAFYQRMWLSSWI